MDLRDLLTNVDVDHAYSWLYIFSHYFYNVMPFIVFLPERFYNKTLATVGVITICHICLNLKNFLTNKKKIADRKERLSLNLNELKEALKDVKENDKNNVSLTDLSFDDLCVKLQDAALDQDMLLVAFRKKAVANKKFNFVAEYIMSSTLMSASSTNIKERGNQALNGIPVSICEAYEMSEKDTTLGLGEYVGTSAKTDAVIVKILKAAGAVPFIRTNSVQALPFCLGLQSSNPIFKRTLNPLSANRSVGGGSCGEACALALHVSTLGVGADLAGGARIPAHFCGVAALRPTPQRLSSQGLLQGQKEVPACVSPMSREVSALVAFMRALGESRQADIDPRLPQMPFDENEFSSSKPLRIGYYTDDLCTRTTPPVHRAIFEAKKHLEQNGHKLVQFEPPDLKHMLTNLLYPATMGSNRVLLQLLSQDVVGESTRDFYYTARISSPLRWILAWWMHAQSPMEEAIQGSSLPVTMTDWWQLMKEIQEFRQNFHLRWKNARLDALLCPVYHCAAMKRVNEQRFLACLTHVGLFSLLSYPAGTVSITSVRASDLPQFHRDRFRAVTALETLMTQDQVGGEASGDESAVGLPVGVQVAALPFHEETVLRLMTELELIPKQGPTVLEDSGSSLISDPNLTKPEVHHRSVVAGSSDGSISQSQPSEGSGSNDQGGSLDSGTPGASLGRRDETPAAEDNSVLKKKGSKTVRIRTVSDLTLDSDAGEEEPSIQQASDDRAFTTPAKKEVRKGLANNGRQIQFQPAAQALDRPKPQRHASFPETERNSRESEKRRDASKRDKEEVLLDVEIIEL